MITDEIRRLHSEPITGEMAMLRQLSFPDRNHVFVGGRELFSNALEY